MKISFDLDGTLIPDSSRAFPIENRPWWHKLFSIEEIRKGSPLLIKTLRTNGHRVGIYTTSFRKNSVIQLWLMCYGIKADFIINEKINMAAKFKLGIDSSKYPPAFDIDLHIDDLPGVSIEGARYGFRTLILPKENIDFLKLVYKEVDRLLDS